MTDFKEMPFPEDIERMDPEYPLPPFHAGGKIVVNTAEEERRRFNLAIGGQVYLEMRNEVSRALTEIEERDRYLKDLKNEIVWKIGYANIFSGTPMHLSHLAGYLRGLNRPLYLNPGRPFPDVEDA